MVIRDSWGKCGWSSAGAKVRKCRVRAAAGNLAILPGMCRSIVTLRRPDQDATDDEVRAAALQFVRKISGYRVPSKKNEAAFNAAVDEIAHASRHLLEAVTAKAEAPAA